MLTRNTIAFIIMLITSACSAETTKTDENKIKFGESSGFYFSSRFGELTTPNDKKDVIYFIKRNWFEPSTVKYKQANIKVINNCSELLEDIETYSESGPSEYSNLRFEKMYCMSLKKIAVSDFPKRSFLPNDLVYKESPTILPKEFIPIYSNEDEEFVNALPNSSRWKDGVTINSIDDSETAVTFFIKTLKIKYLQS